jgi:hypothetical protein
MDGCRRRATARRPPFHLAARVEWPADRRHAPIVCRINWALLRVIEGRWARAQSIGGPSQAASDDGDDDEEDEEDDDRLRRHEPTAGNVAGERKSFSNGRAPSRAPARILPSGPAGCALLGGRPSRLRIAEVRIQPAGEHESGPSRLPVGAPACWLAGLLAHGSAKGGESSSCLAN